MYSPKVSNMTAHLHGCANGTEGRTRPAGFKLCPTLIPGLCAFRMNSAGAKGLAQCLPSTHTAGFSPQYHRNLGVV